MGISFGNVQIRNEHNNTKGKFMDLFRSYMEKNGYVTCDEDDAESTYYLSFKEGSKWVTLGSENYNRDDNYVCNDASEIAEGLQTCCLSVYVVGGDFAMVNMYNKTSSLTDRVIIGNCYNEDDNAKGEKEHWEEFLKENATWEQLQKAFSGEYVFAQEGVREFAEYIDMEPRRAVLNFDFDNDINTEVMYFMKSQVVKSHPTITVTKNAVEKSEKKLTLNSAFKKVFGPALEPLGFVKIKSRYPYYVRLINDEILHVITFKEGHNYTFTILCGVATVYRKEINLSGKPIGEWFNDVFDMYQYTYQYKTKNELKTMSKQLRYIKYSPYVDSVQYNCNLISGFKYALDITQKYTLPILESIDNIQNVIDYTHDYNTPHNMYFKNKQYTFMDNESEGLLKIKFCNAEDLFLKSQKRLQKSLDIIRYHIENNTGEFLQEEYDLKQDKFIKNAEKRKINYNKYFSDKEWYNKVIVELDKRKEYNTEILKWYGLI
ncbi:MAG: hypothetical protein E7510_04755 [Ruminococcus sp.]|nr:hypothetical protein [Ruminococcus sp.]